LVVGRGLLGEGLIVGLAGQVLAAADELHRPLEGGVVLGHAGGDEGVDAILGVGQVGPFALAVADTAVLDVLILHVLLQLLEQAAAALEDGVVAAIAVGPT